MHIANELVKIKFFARQTLAIHPLHYIALFLLLLFIFEFNEILNFQVKIKIYFTHFRIIVIVIIFIIVKPHHSNFILNYFFKLSIMRLKIDWPSNPHLFTLKNSLWNVLYSVRTYDTHKNLSWIQFFFLISFMTMALAWVCYKFVLYIFDVVISVIDI